MTDVVDVCKGQTNMSSKGELQTTEPSMIHQVCPGETQWLSLAYGTKDKIVGCYED